MDPPYLGFLLDPSKCSLGMGEKRELIRELAKWPESAPEKLQKWTRRDLLEILCEEMGKERKYTGLPKQKLIEYIFRIVSDKKSGELVEDEKSACQSPRSPQAPFKRQRKAGHTPHIPSSVSHAPSGSDNETVGESRYCMNLACRAALSKGDYFCKRCSCCICHKYDDNKDPSLWLVCGSEIVSEDLSCGMSCHLECAMKHERSGITGSARLDGSYYCFHCGKVNDLLGCWKKQLMVAKDARRVDVLGYRIALSHRILLATEKYQDLHGFVDLAMIKLQDEVGPLEDGSRLGRGIVNRLSVGSEVQRLCAEAVALLDSFQENKRLADHKMQEDACSLFSSVLKIEGTSPASVTFTLNLMASSISSKELVGYTLWQRKADEEYPVNPTFKISKNQQQFVVSKLAPATDYVFKLIASSNTGKLGKWEVRTRTKSTTKDVEIANLIESSCGGGVSNPSSEGNESNNVVAYQDLNKSPDSCFAYDEKPCILDLEKSLDDDDGKDVSQLKDTCVPLETMEFVDTPRHSISTLDEEPISMVQPSQGASGNSSEQRLPMDVPEYGNETVTCMEKEMVIVPYGCIISSAVTPCGSESGKTTSREVENGTPTPDRGALAGSSSKKRSTAKCKEPITKDRLLEGEYEYCVRVIRWLECEGHIETNFRVKFLTWFSLRATSQERKVISVFVDTLRDDPGSLAEQLMDTFSEVLCSKRPPPFPAGFCMRLWH